MASSWWPSWPSWQCVYTTFKATVKAYWNFYVMATFLQGAPFLVYKAVALNEDREDVPGSTLAITVTRALDLSDWEPGVRAATGWSTGTIRVDVRFLAHGRKFRAVLRPGDDGAVIAKACETHGRHMGGPRGVMSAELRGPLGVTTVDVTQRVLKYQGPTRDFYGATGMRVGVLDMFPSDDVEELAASFEELVVLDSHFKTHRVPIECRDLALALQSFEIVPAQAPSSIF